TCAKKPMPKIRVDDIDIHYEVRGKGAPLLLIMGSQGNLDWWPEELKQGLEKHFRLIMFDNRGAGRTGEVDGQYRIPQMADDAAGLLEALEIPRAHVFGVSMGGMIAQEFALRHPKRVDHLVLGCTHPGLRHGVRWNAA